MMTKSEFRMWLAGVSLLLGLLVTVCVSYAASLPSADKVEALAAECDRQAAQQRDMRLELKEDICAVAVKVDDSRRELTNKMDKLRDIMESRAR